MKPAANLRGKVFGRLKVVDDDLKRSTPGRRYVIVRCACGIKKSTRLDGLVLGATVSCGCKKKEHSLKHGHRRIGQRDPTYQAWDSMVQRCTNPNVPRWSAYGGRGIKVCKRWLTFENFLADMGARPAGRTLERRKNHLGYTPSNCVWATHQEQMRNTRKNVWVRWRGRERLLCELADAHGIPVNIASTRVRRGWSAKRALTTPYIPRR
jgi:hypothetical protein